MAKTYEMGDKFFEFFSAVGRADELLDEANEDAPVWALCYHAGVGYISVVNSGRDQHDVYYYGKNENEAFINGVIEYEYAINSKRYFMNRKEYNSDFRSRFLKSTPNGDYYGSFYYIELALQDFRKFYGDKIPKEVLEYYDRELKAICHDKDYNFAYDDNKNQVVKKRKRS